MTSGRGAGGWRDLASRDSASAFLGNIFAPQNDFQAARHEYARQCEIASVIQTNTGRSRRAATLSSSAR